MNPYLKGNNAYKKASVTTKDQGTLILMLYDGAIRFLKVAINKIKTEDLEEAHNAITKSKNIISELMTSLNVDSSGRVGASLKSLYVYMFNRLIDANIQKKADYVEEVCELMTELRAGWRTVIDQKKKTAQTNQFNNRSELKPLNIKG
ncbi:MAG: flagellar export chaperone FliS [Proteobacteria bacterium]|nr:flagellar export chaperone FliS [Pseudomonadota bacterium]